MTLPTPHPEIKKWNCPLWWVCRQARVIESSCPDGKKRWIKRLNRLPQTQGNVQLTLRFGGQQAQVPGAFTNTQVGGQLPAGN